MSAADATAPPMADSGVRLCHFTSLSEALPSQVLHFCVPSFLVRSGPSSFLIVLVIGTAVRPVVQARQLGSLLTLPRFPLLTADPSWSPISFIFYTFLIHVCHTVSTTGYCTWHTLKNYSLLIWNSDLTGLLILLYVKPGNPSPITLIQKKQKLVLRLQMLCSGLNHGVDCLFCQYMVLIF